VTFNTKGLMSSLTDEWRTPQSIFDKLDAEFHFDSDPCPMKDKPLKPNMQLWGKSVFVNPPYSQIKEWVEDCYDFHIQYPLCTVVMLIPSRTDTRWWHDYVMKAKEIRFIKGRLKFNDGKGGGTLSKCYRYICVFGVYCVSFGKFYI